MKRTDLIVNTILKMLDESGTTDIQRNELAALIGCAPSQINYVLSSRFTPEQGYIIESRRGGGGYIRISRLRFDRCSAIMHVVNSIGDELDPITARVILENLEYQGLIAENEHRLINAAIKENCYRAVPPHLRPFVRAALLKQLLLATI